MFLSLSFGLPQGSLLGPLLLCYTLYINDLPNVYPTSKISVYVDGTVFYFSGSGCKEVTIVLQDDLNRFEQ